MTVSPIKAPEPDDERDKSAAARQAEADGYTTITICGLDLQIPTGDNVPLRSILRFKGLNDDLSPIEDDGLKAELMGTRELLSPDKWLELLDRHPTWGDYRAIGTKILEPLGN
jgi:hypothetical protein